jgi:hypothetical protein
MSLPLPPVNSQLPFWIKAPGCKYLQLSKPAAPPVLWAQSGLETLPVVIGPAVEIRDKRLEIRRTFLHFGAPRS